MYKNIIWSTYEIDKKDISVYIEKLINSLYLYDIQIVTKKDGNLRWRIYIVIPMIHSQESFISIDDIIKYILIDKYWKWDCDITV